MNSNWKFTAVMEELDLLGVRYAENISMKTFSYFKSGGNARLLVCPESEDDLAAAVIALNRHELTYKVVGRTTNLLFLDDETYSVLISTKGLDKHFYDQTRGLLYVETGLDMAWISRYFLSHHFVGFEGLEGIPGSLGGAVFMNASAYGTNLSQTLVSVRVWDGVNGFTNLQLDELNLGYRTSIFHEKSNRKLIIGAVFKCEKGDFRKIYKKMSLYHNKRHKYQEFMYPTLGSIFAGSVYRELAKINFRYYLVSSVYYFFNYRFKIFRRESPDDRRWINEYTAKVFNLKFEENPFSEKDMNTLINNGQHTDVYIDYIKKMQNITHGKLKLENEVVEGF